MSEDTSLAIQQNQPESMPALPATTSVARSELEAQVALAIARPRNVSEVIKKAMGLATMDKTTAVRMFYSLDRNGKPMSGIGKGAEKFGPSVRLTEIFTSVYRNLRVGSQLVSVNDEHVVVKGYAHDLETNSQVERSEVASILTSTGKRYGETTIVRTIQSAASKAERNALLKIIPRVFVEKVMEQCIRVVEGTAKDRNTRWKELVLDFSKCQVTEKQMLQLINKTGIADLGMGDIYTLEGDLDRIQSGEETIDSLLASLQADAPKSGASDVG